MSSLPTYPNSGTVQSSQLMTLLGSYWNDYFGDSKTLVGLQKARAALFDQTVSDSDEAELLVSRNACPVFHRELWTPLYLRKSVLSDESLSPLKYGTDKALYGLPSIAPYDKLFTYGASLVAGTVGTFPLPDKLQHVRMLCNRISDPTIALVEGVDFKIDLDEELIILPLDVFNDPRIATRSIINEAGQPDVEALLWAFSCDVDEDYIWNHYGYVLDIRAPSSTSYRSFLNAVYDMHTGAPSTAGLLRMLSAAYDVPLAIGDETVQLILSGRKKQIITDKRVYVVPAAATVLVAVGDVLTADQPLVDTVQVVDLAYADDQLKIRSLQPVVSAVSNLQLSIDRTHSIMPYGHIETETYTPMGVLNGYNACSASYPANFLFKGFYTNEAPTLNLTGLAAHNMLEVSFDLLIFGEWTGNDGTAVWELKVDGETLLSTNFSNDPAHNQAYPDAIGVGNNPRYTVAVEPTTAHPIWSLYVAGYVYKQVEQTYDVNTQLQPARYRFTFTVPHTRPTAVVEFAASGLPTGMYAVNSVIGSAGSMSPWGPVLKRQSPDVWGTYNWAEKDPDVPSDWEIVSAADTVRWSDRSVYEDQTYPAASWGLQNLTVNLLSSSRRLLTNIPASLTTVPDLPGIAADNRFLKGTYFSSLFFPNEEVPLVYDGVDADGYVKVHFDLSGFPADVTQFWDDVHTRGVAQGWTLANYLDQRVQPLGQPAAKDLPRTVNPMLFLIRHFLKANTLVLKLRAGLEGDNALDADMLNLLRWTLPPHVAYIIFIEIVVPDTELTDPILTETYAATGPDLSEELGISLSFSQPAVNSLDGVVV